MRNALSAGELALLRTRPQQSRFYLATHRPRTVFTAQLLSVPDNFPGSVLQLQSINGGSITEASRGMTVRIGSIAGRYDYGTLRVRKASTSVTLNVSEFGSGLVNFPSNACIAVLEEFSALPIHKSYSSAASNWLLDLDTYTSQLTNYGPLALMGPPVAGFMENGKMAASFVGDWSYSLTPGVSITSQTWLFPDGQTVTSKLGSSLNPVVMTFTNASSGGRYFTLTVTDSNGASHIGQRLIFAFNPSAGEPHPVTFDQITGGLRSGGYTTRVYTYNSGTSQQFHDGAQVVIFERASYGTAGSSVGGNFPFRSNVVLNGWISDDSMRIEPFTGDISFNVETINGVLQKTSAYDLFLESGSAASAWDMASGLTIDKAGIALVKYYSTIGNVTDFNLASGIGMTNEIPYRSMPLGSLWGQLTYNYEGILGLVASDMQSSIYAAQDVQMSGGSANVPVVMDVTKQDRRDTVTIDHEHRSTQALQRLYAVMGGTLTAIGAEAPGQRSGYFGAYEDRTGNLTAPDQDTLITWAGNMFAQKNNPYKRVNIPLAGNMRLDSVPQARITMSLSSNDNVRGLEWSNKTLLPYETTLTYNAQGGYVTSDITAETSVNGIGGSSITFPTVISSPITNLVPPDVSLPVATTPSEGGTVFAISGTQIVTTSNFFNPSPTWSDITGTVTGTMVSFRLDPWDPANKAVVCTSNGIWYTSNIRSATPTWTQSISLAQMQTATVAGSLFLNDNTNWPAASMWMSPNVNGYVAVIVWGGSTSEVYFGRTNNYTLGNTSWTWTSTGTATRGHYMVVSTNTTSKVYITHISGFVHYIRYSSDGGATFSTYTGPINAAPGDEASAGHPFIFLPPSDTTDQIVYVGNNGSTLKGQVFKSTTGANGPWTDITPSISGNKYGPGNVNNTSIEMFTESPASDGNHVYMVGTNGLGGATAVFQYNGSSWTTLKTGIGINSGDGFGGWPYNNSTIRGHDMGFGTGHVGYSLDGGMTWNDAIGNLASVIGAARVKFLVPIWTKF